MNDEGVGIAGWLLADLALVLAIVFLAFTPAALSSDPEPDATPTPEPTVAPPIILDIGCTATDGREQSIAVRCKPDLGGGAVDTYDWEPERGRRSTAAHSDNLEATFDGAGAVRLTVSNDGGEHAATFAVLPTPTPTPEGELVVEDFRFDQIVVTNVTYGAVTWDTIAAGRVRLKLDESKEDTNEGHSDLTVVELLRERLDDGLRIALVETFSHEPQGRHLRLSDQVNTEFFEGLREELYDTGGDVGDFFVECDARQKWFAKYRDTGLDENEVRINLYFVNPRGDTNCE